MFTAPAGMDDRLDVDPLGRWLLALPDDFVLKDPVSTIGPYCSSKPQRATVDDVAITTTP